MRCRSKRAAMRADEQNNKVLDNERCVFEDGPQRERRENGRKKARTRPLLRKATFIQRGRIRAD